MATPAQEDRLWAADDVLAAPARVAGERGVGAHPPSPTRPPRLRQRHQWGTRRGGQRRGPGKKGSQKSAPNPTDRGKHGSKRHILVDANGIPLALTISATSRHDSRFLKTLVDAVPAIRQCAGRPRRCLAKLQPTRAMSNCSRGWSGSE
ncbi:transposase, partial [Azospirillum sp. ROY-1-1-2]|nr:transposase [Azospirillum oleiclasticum]